MVRVKICGVTSVEEALAAVEAGADALGLNFYPPSPRALDLSTAQAICRALPPFVVRVGVFVDQPAAKMMEVAATCGLDCLQLHGAEPPETGEVLRPRRVIKAFRLRTEEDLERLWPYVGAVDAFLLDAYVPGQPGGTGQTFDWALAVEAQQRFPAVPVILAGGLTPENVARAVRQVQPYAVDVASGVERPPGRKDPAKMRAFVRRAKGEES